MRILIWGSRALTWRHFPLFRMIAAHALYAKPPPMEDWLATAGVPQFAVLLPSREPLILLNGDGPPGRSDSNPGAIGADQLALLACMETWPEKRRRVKWFRPEKYRKGNMSWAQGAAARNVAMADAMPNRCYCIHTDLDSSRGSIITAQALTERKISYWYIRTTMAGALVSVEPR